MRINYAKNASGKSPLRSPPRVLRPRSPQVFRLSIFFFSLLLLVQTTGFGGERQGLDDFLAKCGYLKVKTKPNLNNHLRLQAKVNGKTVECIVDTGCPDTVIDPARTPKLPELRVEHQSLYGPVGVIAQKYSWATIETLELGGFIETNSPVACFSLSKIQNVPVWVEKQELIVGLGFLQRRHALISFQGSSCLYLRTNAPDQRTAALLKATLLASGLSAVPLKGRETGAQFVEAAVNGEAGVFRLDTGASHTFLDFAVLQKQHLSSEHTPFRISDLSGTSTQLKLVKIRSLQIGDFELTGFPVGTFRESTVKPAGKQEALECFGLLGPDVLSRGWAIIDCGSDTLYLKGQRKIDRVAQQEPEVLRKTPFPCKPLNRWRRQITTNQPCYSGSSKPPCVRSEG